MVVPNKLKERISRFLRDNAEKTDAVFGSLVTDSIDVRSADVGSLNTEQLLSDGKKLTETGGVLPLHTIDLSTGSTTSTTFTQIGGNGERYYIPFSSDQLPQTANLVVMMAGTIHNDTDGETTSIRLALDGPGTGPYLQSDFQDPQFENFSLGPTTFDYGDKIFARFYPELKVSGGTGSIGNTGTVTAVLGVQL